MMFRLSLLSVGISIAGPALAQCPRGQGIPKSTAAVREADADAFSVRLRSGRDAIASGNVRVGTRHLRDALELAPAATPALEELLRASVHDDDARVLWALRWWASAMDERGRIKLDRHMRDVLPAGDLAPSPLGAARAAAVAELARFVERLKSTGKSAVGNGVLVRWATDLAWALMRGSPKLQDRYGPELDAAPARFEPDVKLVVAALEWLAKPPLATGRKPDDDEKRPDLGKTYEIAMRAARCLTGLAAQAKFKKLEGPPPPPLGSFDKTARKARARLRQRIEDEWGPPLTVEELRQMDAAERERFNERHATWANPAIGVSPGGRYVVQTTCGHATLLGALETIEMHHARLVDWFGKDPFKSRPGLVRIVRRSSGLESEDSPFWWAGGFQRGDLTVVRLSWGTVSGLGRGLTHELTHRFDGKIYPGLPAWLVEGRAVFTAGAYGNAEDKHFVPNYLNAGQIQTPFIRGYGRRNKLEKLLKGTIDDYRDNYSAGHALFVFLSTWADNGKPLFAKQLERFLKNPGRKDPVERFVGLFADGRSGRPKGLDGFVKLWSGFLRDCYQKAWGDKDPAWLKERHTTKRTRATRTGLILDEPTFSWARDRAEPWFGDEHAARAGRLLAEVGNDSAAAAALLWSLRTDGCRRASGRLLADVLARLGRKPAAWVARYETARRHPSPLGIDERAPMTRSLPKLLAFFRQLKQLVKACDGAGLSLAADVLRAEHRRLGAHVGLTPLPQPAAPARTSELYPREPQPHRLGLFGWVEDGLTGYEERRVKGLWFEDEQGDLHVGRPKPRKGTGTLDRRAVQRDAFVRTREWQDVGGYVLRTRIHFTTSFVSGSVILGYTRRDRNIRLGFSAGDFLYSIGRKNDAGKTKSVRFSLRGLWEREGPLWGSTRHHKFEFEHPRSSFQLEVHVSGPSVRVLVEGRPILAYTTADLSPIEGSIGFAMGQGAIRVQQPVVAREASPAPAGLRLDRASQPPLSQLVGLGTVGLPRHPNGTIAIWISTPGPEDPDAVRFDFAHAMRRLEKFARDRLHFPQGWCVIVPKSTAATTRKSVANRLAALGITNPTILEHARTTPTGGRPWALFVDSEGVLRLASRFGKKGWNSGPLERWARCYRR